MNIGIEATSATETQKAGVGYYTANLIQAMVRLGREDHHYTFYLRKPWSDPLWLTESERHPKFASKVLSFPYLWAQVRLPFELWRHPQDVYFFPSPVIPLLYQPARSVITIHDVAFLFFPECFAPLLRRWLSIATPRGIAQARKIIAVSAATKQDLMTYYGVPAEKVVVIHHGVHEMYRPLSEKPSAQDTLNAIKQKYQIEGVYLLCLGTLQRRKNIPRLLQAFSILKQKYNIPHKLVLVGQKNPDLPEQEIFATIEGLLLQKEVFLL